MKCNDFSSDAILKILKSKVIKIVGDSSIYKVVNSALKLKRQNILYFYTVKAIKIYPENNKNGDHQTKKYSHFFLSRLFGGRK